MDNDNMQNLQNFDASIHFEEFWKKISNADNAWQQFDYSDVFGFDVKFVTKNWKKIESLMEQYKNQVEIFDNFNHLFLKNGQKLKILNQMLKKNIKTI
jgi:hypothetical protein